MDQKIYTVKKEPGKAAKCVSWAFPSTENFRFRNIHFVFGNRKRKIFELCLVSKPSLFSVKFAAVDLPHKKAFVDELYNLGGDEVEALFNGFSDNMIFNDDPEKCKGILYC